MLQPLQCIARSKAQDELFDELVFNLACWHDVRVVPVLISALAADEVSVWLLRAADEVLKSPDREEPLLQPLRVLRARFEEESSENELAALIAQVQSRLKQA